MKLITKLTAIFFKMELRNRAFVIPSFLFPILMLVLMAVAGGNDASKRGVSYVSFLTPGILGMAYAAVALVAVPVMLASYREKGILRQFKIAKLPMWKISVSILLSQLLFMLIQTAVVIVFGCLLLGAHFNFSTSSTLVIPALLLGLFSMLAVGFALGAFLPNSRAATMTGNMVNLVAIFLGGVFFPVDTWPGYIRPLTFINPLTWIVEGLRKATLYGTMNLTTAGIEMAILAILGVIATAITLKFFRYE